MITAIDKNTALVLIDLQKGIVKMSTAHPISDILEKAKLLVDAFHKEGLPVIAVNVIPKGDWLSKRKDGTAVRNAMAEDFAEIVPEIGTLPTDIFVTKHTWNAFYNTALHAELQKRNITNIVLGGVSTSIGVEGTARAASELAYNISFATDAMTDTNSDAHKHSTGLIFPRIGESGSTADILEKLKDRA